MAHYRTASPPRRGAVPPRGPDPAAFQAARPHHQPPARSQAGRPPSHPASQHPAARHGRQPTRTTAWLEGHQPLSGGRCAHGAALGGRARAAGAAASRRRPRLGLRRSSLAERVAGRLKRQQRGWRRGAGRCGVLTRPGGRGGRTVRCAEHPGRTSRRFAGRRAGRHPGWLPALAPAAWRGGAARGWAGRRGGGWLAAPQPARPPDASRPYRHDQAANLLSREASFAKSSRTVAGL